MGATSEQGMAMHQQVQRKRVLDNPAYEPEKKIAWAFERDGYRFEVEGRMDGYVPGNMLAIEEIKATFDLAGLEEGMRRRGVDHPYVLQLMTYGYMHERIHGSVPELRFHLASVRSKQSVALVWPWDAQAYTAWLDMRLAELVDEARRSETRAKRRKKSAASLAFPFPTPRRGQTELIATVAQGLAEGKSLLIQAPTGLGKTVGVLYPVLQSAFARGQSVFYATPKNSQHQVAEEALEGFRAQGAKLKGLTLTAKTKLCLKEEVMCRPEYCEYARDYHDKVRKSALKDVLRGKKRLTPAIFKLLGRKHVVCPYELQFEAAEEADVVIGDYNHVFAPLSALSRVPPMLLGAEGKPELVVDEAHNLPARAMDYYSPALSTRSLESLREGLRLLPRRLAKEAEELLDGSLALIARYHSPRPHAVNLDPQDFQEHDVLLRGLLTRYFETDAEVSPRDPLFTLCSQWTSFIDVLVQALGEGREEFFVTYQPTGGGVLKITCCDASEMLRPKYKEFEHAVAFSATLRPFEFYSRLTGLEGENLVKAEFASPFDPEKRKLMLIPQVSTKFSERGANYGKIAEAIARLAGCREGNYLAFFPSFAFMEEVRHRFIAPAGTRLVVQEKNTPPSKVRDTLENLKDPDDPTILFAVQGGVYAEGVDYPGDMAIGAFVVGPPLPTFDVEREGMREYYERRYGQGFNYAYAYPAMAKAVQAAGRVIRREDDRGLVVLMDGRFLEKDYAASMPADWYAQGPSELVSSSLLKDVADFWDSGGTVSGHPVT